jgi:hypothetical protein
MPRKVFTAGEVLAASDVNDFLMDQTVMVFAGTAARGSAIPTATEGMYAHLNDTDTLTYFDGSDWVSSFSDPGLVPIIPGAVTVSSGTGSVSADGTINFTGVSSFTLDNIFTTSFRNYRAVMSFSSSASTSLRLQWREGGVTGTGNHFWGSVTLSAGVLGSATATTDASALFFSGSSSTTINSLSSDIYSPTDASVRTGFFVTQRRNRDVGTIGGENQVDSSIDGLIISITTGTMSGQLKIYGYR